MLAKNQPRIYKHSNAKSIIIKVVVIFIAAVIILALTAFFGFRKFIAYTDTGKLYLDIPWLYGYMDGPPETDELAPLLAPVSSEEPADTSENDENTTNNADIPDTNDNKADTNSNSSTDLPQYVDPESE